MKLISITEHSDWLELQQLSSLRKWRYHRKRLEFGKQPLELWMFVPCNEDGNVLEKPKLKEKNRTVLENVEYQNKIFEYQQAKERCLFEYFVLAETLSFNTDTPKSVCIYDFLHVFWWHKKESKWILSKGISTIEDLVTYNLELTATAEKKIGL